MTEGLDVTPEGSFAPVFIVDEPAPEYIEAPDIEGQAAERAALIQSGMTKLMALGLTEAEARAIAGG